jgi:hypothetical protein
MSAALPSAAGSVRIKSLFAPLPSSPPHAGMLQSARETCKKTPASSQLFIFWGVFPMFFPSLSW